MGWDGRDLQPIPPELAATLKQEAPEMIFSEGEEVTVKGVVFTVSLIEPPRIVLKAVRTGDRDRLAAAAAKVKEALAESGR